MKEEIVGIIAILGILGLAIYGGNSLYENHIKGWIEEASGEAESPLGEQDKEMVMATVKTFGECAGYYEALSWVSNHLGATESSTQFHNAYNGWFMAGGYLMNMMGLAEDYKRGTTYTQSIADGTAQNFKARLELDYEATMKEMDVFFKGNCEKFVDYQVDLVMQMREFMAQSKE